MLHPRIIPCLLVSNAGLVKTVGFADPKYVGDPLNAVRIFNEKEVDELMLLDIDATPHGREPNYDLIRNAAAECRMPLCYGGGVRTVEHVERIIALGVEKVSLGAAAAESPDLVHQAATRVGSQSVVVVMDVKRTGIMRRYEVFTHRGTRKTGLGPAEFARRMESLGAGEIVVNSIERDGGMAGYDVALVREVRDATSLPLTVLGGAGTHADLSGLIREFGLTGTAAGSLFVFKGKYRAVLINYPNRSERLAILEAAGWPPLRNLPAESH